MLVITVGLLVGCSDATRPGNGSLSFEVADGDEQTGEVGQPLANPLVVRVRNEQGQPVAGQIVNFVVVKGGGSVFAGAGNTNSEGMAQDIWTLGQFTRDTQQVEVRAVDAATGEPHVYATFNATPRAGPPYDDTFTIDTTWSAVGLPVHTPWFQVSDVFGNPVPGTSVTFTVTAGGGSVAVSPLITDSNGSVRPTWTLGPTPGFESQELTIVSQAQFHLNGAIPTPARISAYPTANRQLVIISGDGQTAPAGSQLSQWVIVNVVDGANGSVSDGLHYPMHIAFTSGGGSFGDTGDRFIDPQSCSVDGPISCRFLLRLGATPGQNTFTVSIYGIGQVVITATGT